MNTMTNGKPRRSFGEWWRAFNEPGDAWLDRNFPRIGRVNRFCNRHEGVIAIILLAVGVSAVFLVPIIAPKLAIFLVRCFPALANH